MGYDIVFKDVRLVDGSGKPARAADLAVEGDRIARIDAPGLIPTGDARHVIDGQGAVLAPGFIDTHTHDDRAVLIDAEMMAKISQGVTTVVTGNCGISLAPLTLSKPPPAPLNLLGDQTSFVFESFADYAEAIAHTQPAVNVAALIGHGTLRVRTMDDITRPATPTEIDKMRRLLRQSLAEGAIGFSTGLFYPINEAADADEVVALAELLADFNGIYATHMRDEGRGVMDSIEETILTAKRANTAAVISHHKCAGPENWGRSVETLAKIAAAAKTQPLGLDAYPYAASSTVLNPKYVRDDIRIMVSWSDAVPEAAGQELSEIARDWGCTAKEAAERLQPAGAIYFQMDEADVRRILAFPLTMIGSDGLPHDRHPHPRLWGTFTRVLGHYCREEGLFPLEEAVRKMTGLPAERFGLSERGYLREGYVADLVLFDPLSVRDRATFESPREISEGILCVVVNGALAWRPGDEHVQRHGRLLRHAV
ncbi:MAG: D-aminoacylase [Acetobacteraceae bacterium]|nr:D-aminoacylase [Acetobacteraceae bacterium]